MRVMRAEPRRFTDVTPRSVGAVWRAYDLQLTTYVALLGAIGLVMAYTNSVEAGESVLRSGTTFTRALMWTGLAIVVFTVATLFDYHWLKAMRWPIWFANIGLLVLTLAIGDGVGGSSRWVSIGPLTFQFSEIAKILMIVVLAAYLAGRQGRLDSLPPLVGACLLAGMLWMSGASLRWLTVLAVGVAAMIPIAWTYLLRDYQKARLEAFFNAAPDVQGAGFQLHQAQIAVGAGGLIGKGLTNGTQTQGAFLPVQATDFVFATLAEELGFIGGVVLFVLFVLLLWRVLVAGWRSRDAFGTLFAAGVASMILFQLLVNVGMVLGIMPITGIPLPFVTHGGASLVSMAAGLGILQSINIRQTRAAW